MCFQNEIYAISPVFPRQVIIDGSNDWNYSNFLASPSSKLNSSQCNQNQSFFSSTPDIEEINYLSDGKTLNATIWLSSAFKEPTGVYDFSLNETALPSAEQDSSSGLKNLVSIETKNLSNSSRSKNLDDYTNQRILSLRQLPSFHSESVEMTKLSGNPAHQISYTYKKLNEDLHATKIWSIIGDKLYVITFLADKDRYSYYLPVVRKIIKSFSSDTANMSDSSAGIFDGYNTYLNKSLGIKIKYPADWRPELSGDIPGRVLFYPPFQEEVFKTGTTIVMAMDVNSGYDFRGEDYRVTLDWDPSIKNWTKSVQESRSSVGGDRALGSGEYILLDEQDNYGFFFDKEKNYVKLTMDLSLINYPDQYSLVFFITEAYTNRNSTCNIDLFDMSDEVHVPPPDFTFVVSPSSVSLRPGEEENME